MPSDTGQVQGTNGTFYGGDVPLGPEQHPSGQRTVGYRHSQPRNPDLRVPALFEGNQIVKWQLTTGTFSGSEIASGGEPIFSGFSGTDLLGCHHRHQLRGRRRHLWRRHELQLRFGHQRPSSVHRPQQHPHAGIQRLRLPHNAHVPIHEKISMQFIGGGVQPAQPQDRHGREQHLHYVSGAGSERNSEFHSKVHMQHCYATGWFARDRVLCALHGYRALGIRNHLKHQQQ